MNDNGLILVPTDFSEVCENAISHAADIARAFGYKVVILHVLDKESKSLLRQEGQGPESIGEKLNQLKEKFFSDRPDWAETHYREGSIFTTINEMAAEKGAKILVLGTHGKIGFQRLTGSYAMRVISDSEIPVIVVQKKQFKAYREILFPVSLYSEDRQKVNWAIHIARSFGARIHILPKFETDPDLEKRMIGVVFQIKRVFRDNGVEFIDGLERKKVSGFDRQVIAYAEKHEVDLIMVMTGEERVFSSWDEKILFNQSQIPVMCINPREIPGMTIVWNY